MLLDDSLTDEEAQATSASRTGRVWELVKAIKEER
jgi:hypothetical protein